MPQVFDRKTGQPVNVSPEEAQAGLASGALAVDADAGPVALKGKSGKTYTFEPGKVADALATGAYSLLPQEEELKRQVAKEEGEKGVLGSLKEAGSSALNQGLFGIPETIRDETDTPEEKAKREAVEEYHKTARFLGGAAGIGGSLLAGGGLFKGIGLAGEAAEHLISPAAELAHAGLAKELAGKALNAATQGALISSPQALTQAAFGDPKKAAETLLWGIGTGAVLGAGAELFSQGASGAAERLGASMEKGGALNEPLDTFANRQALKSTGMKPGQATKIGKSGVKEYGDILHDEGLIQPGMTRQEIGQAIEYAHRDAGQQIGDAIDALDSIVQKPRAKDLLGNPASDDITGRALKQTSIGDALQAQLDSPKMRMPMNEGQANAIQKVIDSANMIPTTLVNGKEVVSFKDANEFVSDLRKNWIGSIKRSGETAGPKGMDVLTPLDKAKADAYEIARNVVHKAGDDVAAASGAPDLVNALANAKKRYARLSRLEEFARTLDATEAGNKEIPLTAEIQAGNGMVGSAVRGAGAALGGALAGPAGAMVGSMVANIPARALDFMAKKWFENKGLVYLSTLAKKAAREGPEVFSAVIGAESRARLEASMATVRDAVQQLAVRGTTSTSANTEHMGHLLGATTGLSSDQQYKKLSDRITTLAANPGAMAQTVGALTAPFQTTAPEVAAEYQSKMMQTLAYLNDSLPKPLAPPMPFAPNNFAPTAAQKMAFHDRAEIVANPMRAMAHVQQGTLSADHLNALQTVYPQVYSMMQQEILKWSAAHPDVKLPLAERQSIAKFLGAPLDVSQSPDSMRAIQSRYAAPPQQPGSKQPAGDSEQGGVKAKIKKLPTSSTAFSGTQGASELHS